MKMRRIFSAVIGVVGAAFILFANSSNASTLISNQFANFAEKGAFRAGITELQKTVGSEPNNQEARFALGATQFLDAYDHVLHQLYRFNAGHLQTNLRNQAATRLLLSRNFSPVFPFNPEPEIVTYEKVRLLISDFYDRLDAANETLKELDGSAFSVAIDFSKINFDIDKNGEISKHESLRTFLPKPRKRYNPKTRKREEVGPRKHKFVMDAADGKWLRGHVNGSMSYASFLLAFDFSKTYDASFQLLFGNKANSFGGVLDQLAEQNSDEIPDLVAKIEAIEKEQNRVFSKEMRARLPKLSSERRKVKRDKSLSKAQVEVKIAELDKEIKSLQANRTKNRALRRQKSNLQYRLGQINPENPKAGKTNYNQILDFVSLIHTVNWPVIEPDRLKASRNHRLTNIEMGLETFELARSETDDNEEWIPNENQTSPFPDLPVTTEIIESWKDILKTRKAILEGDFLVPNLRTSGGVNLKRFFNEAKSFDLILFVTGPDSAPFLEARPVFRWDQRVKQREVFNRRFWSYLAWFN